jgi:hypothetical protein
MLQTWHQKPSKITKMVHIVISVIMLVSVRHIEFSYKLNGTLGPGSANSLPKRQAVGGHRPSMFLIFLFNTKAINKNDLMKRHPKMMSQISRK